MSKLLRSLLVATAFLALAPNSASARPDDCYNVCDATSSCDLVCWYNYMSTCGAWGVCAGARAGSSEAMASVAQDDVLWSDASLLICSEEQQRAR